MEIQYVVHKKLDRSVLRDALLAMPVNSHGSREVQNFEHLDENRKLRLDPLLDLIEEWIEFSSLLLLPLVRQPSLHWKCIGFHIELLSDEGEFIMCSRLDKEDNLTDAGTLFVYRLKNQKFKVLYSSKKYIEDWVNEERRIACTSEEELLLDGTLEPFNIDDYDYFYSKAEVE